MKNNRYSLRALSALMGYPDTELRSHLPELPHLHRKFHIVLRVYAGARRVGRPQR